MHVECQIAGDGDLRKKKLDMVKKSGKTQPKRNTSTNNVAIPEQRRCTDSMGRTRKKERAITGSDGPLEFVAIGIAYFRAAARGASPSRYTPGTMASVGRWSVLSWQRVFSSPTK